MYLHELVQIIHPAERSLVIFYGYDSDARYVDSYLRVPMTIVEEDYHKVSFISDLYGQLDHQIVCLGSIIIRIKK